jgi:eukaryotic-like serine/threonine-protein kinase
MMQSPDPRITLTAGSRVGHYEILGPIGAGGMGEVYRAHDSRLRRDVAIKILPIAFAADADRVRRFEQEALASGMLNHPNLLTVYDVGTHEDTPFLVSELLEGKTLRDMLIAAPGVKKAIHWASQIATGLAAAHDKGIVHRDLKPENIFILPDGRVKLLDFGLAKLLTLNDGEGDDSARTAQRHLTHAGMVVGTAGYMSPEQVRGEAVDHRCDLFSLGIVLHEMLTGITPFLRVSAVETMNAIIHDDPPPLDKLPHGVAQVLLHALEKSPANRFQSARDFSFALLTIASGESHPALLVKPTVAVERQPPLYRRMTFRRGFIMSARFAPDGSVIYGAAWEDNPLEIFSSYQTGPEARPLGLRDADILSISSTGELVGYATTGMLARVPLAGGAPRRVCQDMQEADWTRDGKNFLLVRRVDGFYRIESPIGTVIYKTPRWISRAKFSPNEELIAFIEHPLWGAR